MVPTVLTTFETTLTDLHERFSALAKVVAVRGDIDVENKQALENAVFELREAVILYAPDAKWLRESLAAFSKKYDQALPEKNELQHAARKAFDPNAEAIRGLVKQVDLLYKLTARINDIAPGLALERASANVSPEETPAVNERGAVYAVDSTLAVARPVKVGQNGHGLPFERRATAKLLKKLDEARKVAVEQLKHAAYFHRQVAWLQDRFPKAELEAVPGLVKLVDRAEIEAADWSLTPGRYVGVAPPEEDEDFDFEQTLRDIHTELAEEIASRVYDFVWQRTAGGQDLMAS